MSVYNRGNKWYCRFQINGERHNIACQGAKNKTQALIMENAYKLKILTPQEKREKHSRIKMNDLFYSFENYSKQNKLSYRSDKVMLSILNDYFANIDADKVVTDTVERFKYYLINTRKVKHSTVNRYLAILSKTFNIAVANGVVNSNPIKNIKRLRENNFKIRSLSNSEEKLLNKSLELSPKYLKDIVTIALNTAMRKSEILNLKWFNIDFNNNIIELLETKSGKSRIIPMNKTVISLLTSLKHVSEHVFTLNGKKIGDIKKCWASALKRANINNFRFHDLRHTAATRMIEKGVDIITVKEILGHADISTTMRYTHSKLDSKRLAVGVLG